MSSSAGAGGASPTNASAEGDVDLMRTILGEHVPQSVILTCLTACAFDVSAALNWYFAELAASSPAGIETEGTAVLETATRRYPVHTIQLGLSLSLHARAVEGMVASLKPITPH